jgi:CDP-paratose 2-epimerase
MPIFITDSRKVIETTGWQPKRDGKTLITDIYDWIRDHESQLSTIF